MEGICNKIDTPFLIAANDERERGLEGRAHAAGAGGRQRCYSAKFWGVFRILRRIQGEVSCLLSIFYQTTATKEEKSWYISL